MDACNCIYDITSLDPIPVCRSQACFEQEAAPDNNYRTKHMAHLLTAWFFRKNHSRLLPEPIKHSLESNITIRCNTNITGK